MDAAAGSRRGEVVGHVRWPDADHRNHELPRAERVDERRPAADERAAGRDDARRHEDGRPYARALHAWHRHVQPKRAEAADQSRPRFPGTRSGVVRVFFIGGFLPWW